MTLVLQYILSALLLFPFIVPVMYLIVMRRMGKTPATLIGRAADITTPFLFIAVYVIARAVIGNHVFLYMVGMTAFIALVFIVMERIREKEYQIKRVLQNMWRLLFLLLAATYIFLIVIGLILQMVSIFR